MNNLYTGEVMTKTSALALLPKFIGRSLGTTIFLWVKSFLPPTGVVDIAAAGVAIVITFAMLASVKSVLQRGIGLNNSEAILEAFSRFKRAGEVLKSLTLADIKSQEKIMEILRRATK